MFNQLPDLSQITMTIVMLYILYKVILNLALFIDPVKRYSDDMMTYEGWCAASKRKYDRARNSLKYNLFYRTLGAVVSCLGLYALYLIYQQWF